MPRPLEGVRILAIEQFGAGPFGSLHLADLGAEVIKIEDPKTGGDVSRTVPPYVVDGDSLYFESFNRNKKSIALDLAVPAGRAVFSDLVVGADAIYSNLRGDVPAALGLRYADVAHLNPAIVCCSLSGFGMSGPRMREPGYDYIVQGMAGWMDVTGEPDGPPTKSGLSLVDFSTGYVAALALTSGLLAARRDGVGMDCDVSLFDTAISMLSYLGVWHLNEGYQPQRISRSAHPSLVPFGTFEAADGWLVIACPKDKFWHRLAGALGRPDLAADDRFRTFADRHRNANELSTIIDSILRTRQRADWLTLLRDAGVPVGEVNSVEQALADPQTVARGMIVETEHPTFGTMSTIASPVRVGSTPPDVRRAPFLGEHTEALLTELLNYDRNRIDEAARGGAFGAVSTAWGRVADSAFVPDDTASTIKRSQPISAGIVTALVGFTSSFAVVLAGLRSVGATPAQAASGLFAMSLVMAVGIVFLAYRYRMPITLAWSTPGAALLAGTGVVAGGWPAAIGAFVVTGLAIVATGIWSKLGSLIASIPVSLAQAMLAGVILPLCVEPVTAFADNPAVIAPVVVVWLLVTRFSPRWAVPAAFGAAAVVIGISIITGDSDVDTSRLGPSIVLTTPQWTWQATIGIALPLYIVTMASQNIPGSAVLASYGYTVPWRSSMAVTGIGTAVTAPAGVHAVNLAAISAALAAAPAAHPDPKKRWIAAVSAGLTYFVLGLGSAALVTMVGAAPTGIVETVAGLALLGVLASSLAACLRDERGREAAAVTFVIAASGVTIAGIGSAFWALVMGLITRATLLTRS